MSENRFIGLTAIQRVRLDELADAYFAQLAAEPDATPDRQGELLLAALSPVVTYCLRERIRPIDLYGLDLSGEDADRYPVALLAVRYIESAYLLRDSTDGGVKTLLAALLREARLVDAADRLVATNPQPAWPDATV